MFEIEVYQHNQFGDIRCFVKDGEPWFVAADVCRALEHSNVSVALDRLDADEKAKLNLGLQGGESNCINEPGLYGLVLGSRKPEAKNFKRWIKHDVLPSIRKHGAYMTPETLEAAILNPDTMIKLCTALKDEQDKRKALEAANSALVVDNQTMRPKAEYFDTLVDRNLLTNFRETAKELGVKEREFVRFLLARKYIYRDKHGKLLPYAAGKTEGLFALKECVNDKSGWKGTQTLVTPKGRETFRLLYLGAVG